MIDSLVFYRECLTRAYFLGKESPDASERSLRFHSEVDLWNVSRTMTGGRRKLDSYVSLRSWRFFFSFWGRGGGESFVVPLGSKGWRGGESARLPPMWSGSNPGVDAIYGNVGWVCCWFSPPLGEVFLRAFRFPLSSKINISKFQFDQESGRRRTTLWMCYL